MGNLAAAWKFTQFLFWTLLLIPPQALAVMIFGRGKPAYIIPKLWHTLVCRAFGLQVETVGKPVLGRQALYAGNHVSYLDIPVLTTVLATSFVAKLDVASWPLFGLLAKLQQTAFVDRNRAAATAGKHALAAVLAGGGSLIIFPEGTSSNGAAVLPFKSTLFGAALDDGVSDDLLVQPFTIELAEVDGQAIRSDADRDLYAWHGDMTLMPHFWNFAKLKGAKLRLHFHAPFQVKEIQDRKALAQACYERVASVLKPEAVAAAA